MAKTKKSSQTTKSRQGIGHIEDLLRSPVGQEVLAEVMLIDALGAAVTQAMRDQRVSVFTMSKDLKTSETNVRMLMRGRLTTLNAYAQAFRALNVEPKVTTVPL